MSFVTRTKVAVTTAALALPILLVTPVTAFAAPGTAGTGENTPLDLPVDTAEKVDPVGGGSSGLVRTIVGLAIVIGVIYGVAWLLRQVKSSREERTTGNGLRHAGTIALGPNRALHLVHAGRELVLVGVAEQGVTPIRTYSEEEAIRLGLIDIDDVIEHDARPGLGLPAPRRTDVMGRQRGDATGERRDDGVGRMLDALRRRTVRR